jgi:phage terminase large subunit-like protein
MDDALIRRAIEIYEDEKRRDFSKLTTQEQLQTLQSQGFPEQNRFVLDQSQFLAALCTRRAGKSNGLAYRFMRTMLKHPGSQCRYIALTRDSAKDIMWGILQEYDEKYRIGAKFTEGNLTMSFPDSLGGATLRLFGADMKNFIKRLKGVKSPGVALDESQDFGTHIESLVDDVLTPTISDYPDGWLALTGTPGPIPHGLFYDITEKGRDGYSVHKWSLYNNPHFPTPREFVAKLKTKKQWADNHPTYLREWMGQWVLDMDALVFKYSDQKNHYENMPALEASGWNYVIGVDIGFDDADAISVIGWHERGQAAYLVDEQVDRAQGITELAHKIGKLIEKYNPLKIVMDTGGLGKKIAEEIRRRFSIPVEAAEKSRKFEYIELLNDAMRMGHFFAKRTSVYAQDCARVKWDQDATVLKISDTYHSDICDSVLYAFRESLHWLWLPEEPVIERNTPEWLAREEERMEKQAEEQAEKMREEQPWEAWA